MAEGAAVPEPLRHPDPEWQKAYEMVGTRHTTADICEYCKHVRYLHTNGCRAESSSLMGDPRPCECTNTAIGSLYRDPTRMKPPETV